MHTFRPRGVCSKLIEVELDGDIIKEIRFTGGPRATSCADQMTYALEEARAQS